MIFETMNPQERLAFARYQRARVQRDFRDAQTMPVYLTIRALIRTSVNRLRNVQTMLNRFGHPPIGRQIEEF